MNRLKRWPWDEYRNCKYAAQNDNDRVLQGGVWTHRLDLAATAAYWKRNGWDLEGVTK